MQGRCESVAESGACMNRDSNVSGELVGAWMAYSGTAGDVTMAQLAPHSAGWRGSCRGRGMAGWMPDEGLRMRLGLPGVACQEFRVLGRHRGQARRLHRGGAPLPRLDIPASHHSLSRRVTSPPTPTPRERTKTQSIHCPSAGSALMVARCSLSPLPMLYRVSLSP
jgi:hypothetical protein